MPTPSTARDLILGISPLSQPNADLVVAVERAGYLGVLDLGTDSGAARAALERVRQRLGGSPFGVRITEGGGFEAVGLPLPPGVDTILLDPVLCDSPWAAMSTARVLAEVTSAQEAEEALRHGAYGLVARGFEAAGRIAELSTFVLVQRLIAAFPGVPVWAMGGIGPHTAAAVVAGGARGVAVDAQLALVAEAGLPAEVAAAIGAMDGSETRVIGGRRVYVRPRRGDEHADLLLVGQDGAFAAPLAARYKTAGGVTRAIGTAITAQVELAARIEPLRDAVPVQGPMTRVSDRAEFAAAVADGGGLPFLALALMSEDEVAELLAQTGALLGGSPWGVGILGFAPREVREAQLAAILRARPPYALIAGGRPAQAAALQEAKIETFLHVPSPVLLDQFLASGARRFVFEGAECGGHIGPRGSFALWEAQVARLLEQPDLNGVHAWFAGGVHDERSAAMVAALAAPLAERGARVSVLMGTAYLFTSQVVESGAVVPLYQRTARECYRTALIESSPGHVVRCADTPYVAAFGAAKDHLSKAGITQQEAWAELERLSLGRLRVAAKGLRRSDDALVTVDEQTARANGMFMLGQVATLRSEVTTIAALHDQVTRGATSFLAGRAAELRGQARDAAADSARARPLDVAIIGMACVYPGADGLESYWKNVVAGTDAVGDVPSERWQKERYPAVPSARGGFIRPVPFDALAYGIPPSALASIEPVQLLALEVATRALADAGYATRPFDRSRASVIFGSEPGSDLSAAYGLRSALPAYLEPGHLEPSGAGQLPTELDEHLPRLTEDSFPGLLGNVIAGRIANRLDLGGANYCVDAACASSLAALDLACKELAAGTSDLVLCGGADTHNGIHDYEMFTSVHALSPNGRCATFDARADGIALGEGVGCLVLKRLADAERDGDRIYAVVGGIGASSDGRSLGLTAPRPEGQRLALERAYTMAGVSPAEVGLIEAHGTGTVAGDRAELATLTAVFAEAGAEPGGCVVGSVKSQIGHTKCAAGLAGLIKVACALHTGTRPGTIHLSEPNAYWDPETSPFTFGIGTARPWPAPPGQRHAGVSAFGFGGTNFHAVLSGYAGADEPLHGLRDWPAELFVLRGDVAEAARQLAELAAANDDAGRPWRLAELAATMAARPGPVRAAFAADSLDDLRQRLREPLSGEPPQHEAGTHGAVAFLFPGQGSQRPDMAADLLTAFPRLQRLLRLADRRQAAAMFPPAAFSAADRGRHAATITDTRMAQPTLGVADLATWELLTMTGVRPDMAAGHSYGELAALCAAGAYDAATLLRLSVARAEAILVAAGGDPGAMASVSADPATVAALLGGTGVVIANYNAPDQVVISGATAAVESAVTALTAAGVPARRLGVACAFHSPLVAPAAAALAETLAGQTIAAPRFPVYANSTAAPYPHAPADMRRLLAAQVADPVRFAEQVEAMYAAGARTFVEVGPGRVLTALVARILCDRPHTTVACDVPGENGLRRFLSALAELVSAGVPIDPGPLFAGRVEPVTGTPPRAPWTVDGHLVRTADGKPVAGGLRPATEAPRLPLGAGADSASSGSASADRDRVVAEFLRTAREVIAAQRDVVLEYLSGPGQEPVAAERRRLSLHRQPPAPPAASAETVPGAAHSPGAAPAVPAMPPGPVEIGAAVVAVISARTGYPPDMLGADLDLEADLSIDSIKRTEIIAALAGRLGLATTGAGIDERIMEELSLIKTVSGITDWLAGHLAADSGNGPVAVHPSAVPIPASLASTAPGGPPLADSMPPCPAPVGPASAEPLSSAPQAAGPQAARPVPGSRTSAGSVPPGSVSADRGLAEPVSVDRTAGRPRAARPRRFLVEPVFLPPADKGPGLAPRGRFLIIDDGRGVALELADLLEQRGADAIIAETPSGGELASTDALVHLGALRPGGRPVLPAAFGLIRDALAARVHTVLVATAGGGAPGRGAGSETLGEAPGDLAADDRTLLGWAFGDGTGDSRTSNNQTSNNRTDNSRAGDGQMSDGRTDNSRTGNNGIGDSRPADSRTGYNGTGDNRAGDSRTSSSRTDSNGTGDSRTHNNGTDNSQTGSNGTDSGSGRSWGEEPCDLGLRGLIRTLATEYPGVLARAVDVEPKDTPREIAAQLLAELADTAGPAVVGYRAGRRTGLHLVEAQPLPAGAATGLDRDSVVLLTGGARGITASVALALARATGCHVELIGRTPPARPVDPELDAADPVALRHILISRGLGDPREIEAEIGRLLRERQVRTTLDGLRAVTASVRYHAADVRDAAAIGAVLADVYARFGRLDGVIHGAGVLEDRLIADKTPASFARVYGTKVDGARALAAGLRSDLRFLVLFGSVSGVLGNRGQADYAAANDALDTLARHWSLRAGRVVTIDWGPWADGGMVSPELERAYARRGVTLIDPDEGVACLLAELAEPTGTAPAQVVYLCGDVPRPSVMGTAGD